MHLCQKLAAALQQKDVSIHADEKKSCSGRAPGGGKWRRPEKGTVVGGDGGRLGQEYLDYGISVKTVSSLDEAIAHINRYIPGIRRQSSQKTTRTRSGSWMRSMLPASMSTHRRVFQTDLNLDLARRSASVPKGASCKRTDGTGCADQHKIYYIWKRADTSVDGKDEDEKRK